MLRAGGAEGRSGIAALLKIVNAPAGKAAGGAPKGRPERDGGASDSDADEPAGAGRGGLAPPGPGARGRRLRPLTRPIICICNDLYAPALRPLRDVARVFHFRKPQARQPRSPLLSHRDAPCRARC
jgi:chromosome transmission fidelity protein 18